MKMSWKAPKSPTWITAKRHELGQRLQAPISVYFAHGRICFTPYLDHTKVRAASTPAMESALIERLPAHGPGKTFMALREETGWPFDDLFAVALSLVCKGKAYPQTDRMGRFVGLYIRPAQHSPGLVPGQGESSETANL